MKVELVLIALLFCEVKSSIIRHNVTNSAGKLAPDEASQVAQSIVNVGLKGFKVLKVRYKEKDIDSCNKILTSIFKVRLLSTREVFEITSVSNVTDADNCESKHNLLKAIQTGGLTRVQHLIKDEGDQIELKDIVIDDFRADMKELEQKDIRIVNSSRSLDFDWGSELHVTEYIELHVRMANTENEYVINITGEFEGYTSGQPRVEPYPPIVLLSLLGGGNYSKMKRITNRGKQCVPALGEYQNVCHKTKNRKQKQFNKMERIYI